MAIAGTNLTSFTSGVDATTITTSSISPTGNRLLLLSVLTSIDTATPNTPTASGNGLTWVEVDNVAFKTAATPRYRLTLLRAMGASPSSGAVTVSFGGQTQEARVCSVDEFSDLATGSNGANAVTNVVTYNPGQLTNPASFGPTLAAFSNSANRPFAVGATDSGAAGSFTPLESATELAEVAVTGGATLQGINVMWQSASADTTPTWSGAAGTRHYAAIGLELVIASTTVVLTQPSETATAQTLAGIAETFDIAQAEGFESSLGFSISGVVTGLAAEAVSSTEINLTWDEFTGATGYDLERNGVVIQEFLPPTTTFLDTGLTANTTYTYRVRAVT